ncbi:MAG TPA: sigma-70 family RNA polymerase sigma factor [Pseudonocardiaceae bacterium]
MSDEPPWWELTGHERHAACLIAARAGDRGALEALASDLTPLVWTVARAQGLDRTHAEDVVQTVWLTFLSNRDSIKEPIALARWLITTTKREAHRGRSRTDREAPLADETLEQLSSQDGLPEPEALRNDRDRRLWRAFRALPARCQELLRLTVLAGRAEYREVAELMRMPHGSIGPTRGRCLNSLRDRLREEGGAR